MASPFDLISLSDVKSWLDISGTDDDVLLAQMITQISRAILSFIDRPAILPADYVEVRDGGNDFSIVLKQWPVIEISSCVINGISIPPSPSLTVGASAQAGYVLETSGGTPPGAMQRLSLRRYLFACGVQNVTISYRAGYQIANESAVIPLNPPYSVPVEAPYGDWGSDAGVTYSNEVALEMVAGVPAAGQYAVTNGIYNFSQADAGATVLISYGYVPADLASCCTDWVAERYAYRSRIGQRSKSLGGQESIGFIVKDIPDYVASTLGPYRRLITP